MFNENYKEQRLQSYDKFLKKHRLYKDCSEFCGQKQNLQSHV